MSAAPRPAAACRAAGAVLCAALALWADPAAAAEGGAESGWGEFLLQVGNFALILAVVVYFARRPLREYLEQRREDVREELEESARLLAEAESRLSQWNERAARLDAELEEIRATSRRLAEEEREEILTQARAMAERIRSDAHAAVEQEMRRARAELSAEAADLAMELAGRILADKVQPDDQQRLFEEFVTRLESAGAAGPGARSNGGGR